MGILIINIIIITIIMLLHVVSTSARHVAWQNSLATVPRIALGVGVTTVDDPKVAVTLGVSINGVPHYRWMVYKGKSQSNMHDD